MPNRTGYEALPQGDEEADVGAEGLQDSPTSPRHGLRRANHPGRIDLRKLDTAFKRWTESIAQKMKRKKKTEDVYSKKEIFRSVFEPQVIAVPSTTSIVKTLDHKPPMTQAEFDAIVHSVKQAIAEGIHPKMITKGSSGSYFARAKVDGRMMTVAVFKPKDEEPYGRLNPKTTKWLHRQLRWIIPFGRACLIPNLSYISEAAASLLDTRLALNIVPPTQLVSLSSQAFFYDWIDRTAFKNGKPLPEKVGSMQYFLHGYQDSSEFLRKHPWPGRSIADTFDDSTHRRGTFSKRFMSALKVVCGKTGAEEVYDDDAEDERVLYDVSESNDSDRPFYWSSALQQSFREELEKLVILDYLMLNTDRGADNYMIKYCSGDHEKSLIDVAPTRSEMPQMNELRRPDLSTLSPASASSPNMSLNTSTRAMRSNSSPQLPYTRQPHIHIAAIDNSLSFPHEHPQGWRSYTYGWLYLPVNLIGRPFSDQTRNHFLPLLTSKAWWEETTFQLRQLFSVDPDFHPKMFNRQLAVIKGQAWNIVQSLRHDDEGPLELTRRTKAMVWDDELTLPEDTVTELINGPLSASASPGPSIQTLPPFLTPQNHRRARSSSSSDFPPPMPLRRTTSDVRPVPFSAKFQRVHPGTTGVTVLEHLERLDAVEAGLERLGMRDGMQDEMDEEEQDVGDLASSSSKSQTKPDVPVIVTDNGSLASRPEASGSLSASALSRVSELPSVREAETELAEEDEDAVEDVDVDSPVDEAGMAAMSKSMSYIDMDGTVPKRGHGHRFTTHGSEHGPRRSLDWMQEEPTKKKTVIAERLEMMEKKPLFSRCGF